MKLIGQICLGILSAALVICIVFWIANGAMSYTSPAQRERNLQELLDPTPTMREKMDAQRESARIHQEYLDWRKKEDERMKAAVGSQEVSNNPAPVSTRVPRN